MWFLREAESRIAAVLLLQHSGEYIAKSFFWRNLLLILHVFERAGLFLCPSWHGAAILPTPCTAAGPGVCSVRLIYADTVSWLSVPHVLRLHPGFCSVRS